MTIRRQPIAPVLEQVPTPRRKPKVEVDCARCVAPGTCCKAFPLSLELDSKLTPAQVQADLDGRRDEEGRRYPFKVLRRALPYHAFRNGDELGATTQWMWSCIKLRKDGRCGIYEKRPSVCRIYEAGSDFMCVHYRGPDGQPVVPQLPKP